MKKNWKTAAIAVLLTAAVLLAAAVAYDATVVTTALRMPVQGGEGMVAVAGLGAALAAIAFSVRELRRMRRWRLVRA